MEESGMSEGNVNCDFISEYRLREKCSHRVPQVPSLILPSNITQLRQRSCNTPRYKPQLYQTPRWENSQPRTHYIESITGFIPRYSTCRTSQVLLIPARSAPRTITLRGPGQVDP